MKHLLLKPLKERNEKKEKVHAYYDEACWWSNCWTCSAVCGGCTSCFSFAFGDNTPH